MKRAWLVILAACSSRDHAVTKGSASANAPSPVVHAQLAWKPLEIDHQPVVELRPQPRMVDGTWGWIGGTATTSKGSYDLIWKLDKLEATPGRGRRSLPDGTWLTDVQSEGDKYVLSLGTSDASGFHFDAFETDDEPIEVIAQFGETTWRVLVFREGVRWRFAHTASDRPRWKIDELPIQGANVASAVDPSGNDLALAWNAGDQGVWMHFKDESAAAPKLPPVEKLAGAITSTCANGMLWVTTNKNTLQRLSYGAVLSPGPSPTIVACNGDAAIVKTADGGAQLCSFECKPTTVPAGEPTVQALIGDDLVMIEQRDDLLAITRHGKRTEYDQGGVIQRMQLIDFDGTPVLVAFGRESLDPTRWTVIP